MSYTSHRMALNAPKPSGLWIIKCMSTPGSTQKMLESISDGSINRSKNDIHTIRIYRNCVGKM